MTAEAQGQDSAILGSAAVIGLGTMGVGIASLLARHDIKVKVVDSSLELAERAVVQIVDRVRERYEVGLHLSDPQLVRSHLQIAESLEQAVEDAEVVIEAIPEDIDLKRSILNRISIANPTAMIASNTSSIPIDAMATAVNFADRFVGVHFFNPAEWIPGVEVVNGSATSAAVVRDMLAVLRRLGKVPVVVESSPGFIANRLQLALFLEALACVSEGLASPEDIDAVVCSTFGFRLPAYGPLRVADMAGLDVYASILEELEEEFGARFAQPELLRQFVAAGQFGLKSGSGIFQHENDPVDAMLERDRIYAAIARATATRSEVPETERQTRSARSRTRDEGS